MAATVPFYARPVISHESNAPQVRSACGRGLPGPAFVPQITRGPCQRLPETALRATSRRRTTQPSAAPLTRAVAWSREVLRGELNYPRIDGMQGVRGSSPLSSTRHNAFAVCQRGSWSPTASLAPHASWTPLPPGPSQVHCQRPCPLRALANGYERLAAVNHGSWESVLIWPFGVRIRTGFPLRRAFQARDVPVETAVSADRAVCPAGRHSRLAQYAAQSVQPPGGR
jgi:hypothetical protein